MKTRIKVIIGLIAVVTLSSACTAEEKKESGPGVTTTTKAPETTTTTSVHYSSCDDSPGPLRKGDPGYRAGLDRDGDGVACDKDTTTSTTAANPVLERINKETDCDVLQAEFDQAEENGKLSRNRGNLDMAKLTTKYMNAADDRMRDIGCY